MRCVDRAGDLHEIEGKEGIDVRTGEDVLVRVAVAVEAVMVIFGVGTLSLLLLVSVPLSRAEPSSVLKVFPGAAWVIYKLGVVIAAGVEASCIGWLSRSLLLWLVGLFLSSRADCQWL